MSSLSYLLDKFCSCCDKRLNTIKKTNIRYINNDELLEKLKSVKNTILIYHKKPLNNNELKINDKICNGCKSYAIKYGTVSQTSNTISTTSSTTSLQLQFIRCYQMMIMIKQVFFCLKTFFNIIFNVYSQNYSFGIQQLLENNFF